QGLSTRARDRGSAPASSDGLRERLLEPHAGALERVRVLELPPLAVLHVEGVEGLVDLRRDPRAHDIEPEPGERACDEVEAAEPTTSPAGSLTWNVSIATPSARVWICAEMMLTPLAASVPAISEKRPGRSRVTTTRSEEPRSGCWNSAVTTGASPSSPSIRRCSAIRCTPVDSR